MSIYVKSERAGRRVLQSISHFLTGKLKLKVNQSKSRVDKPRNCSLLGFSIGRAGRVFVSDKSIRRLKDRIRELTGRNRMDQTSPALLYVETVGSGRVPGTAEARRQP